MPRFPQDRVEHVRRAIAEQLRAEDVRVLVCAAACGADLLALQAAAELGLRRRITLPFPVDIFRAQSVVDRPSAIPWGELYDRFVGEAQSSNDLHLLELDAEDPQAYEKTNKAIIEDALAIASGDEAGLVALVVWDEMLKTEHDYTAQFLHYAQRRHLRVKHIPIVAYGTAI